MKAKTTADYRKLWNAEHAVLQRLLMKDKDYAHALPIFLNHHEMMHSAKLGSTGPWSYQDEVLDGLTELQMRCIPKGLTHSVVWKVWHITRIEDVTMNLLLANSSQVFNTGNWQTKLASPFVNVGNEMDAEEVVALSQAVNIKALLAYRLAVGKRTRAIVSKMKLDELANYPAPERLQRITDEQAVGENAPWLIKYWGGHPSANLLLMPGSRHQFVHFNEIARMTPKLERI